MYYAGKENDENRKKNEEVISETVKEVRRNLMLNIIFKNVSRKDKDTYLSLYETDVQKAYAFLGCIISKQDSKKKHGTMRR